MNPDLHVGDLVRVKPLGAVGTVLRVSERLRRTPYLIEINGCEPQAFGADDLEKLPPASAPIKARRSASGQLVCGTTNCNRILDPALPTCPKCGKPWVS